MANESDDSDHQRDREGDSDARGDRADPGRARGAWGGLGTKPERRGDPPPAVGVYLELLLGRQFRHGLSGYSAVEIQDRSNKLSRCA